MGREEEEEEEEEQMPRQINVQWTKEEERWRRVCPREKFAKFLYENYSSFQPKILLL